MGLSWGMAGSVLNAAIARMPVLYREPKTISKSLFSNPEY